MLKPTPMTSKNRSRSSIFKLNQDTPEKDPWYKFGPNATNINWVIIFTSENCKFSCWNQPPWPRKIGQGHPSSNFPKTLLGYIHGISFDSMRLIFELSCLQTKIDNYIPEKRKFSGILCFRQQRSRHHVRVGVRTCITHPNISDEFDNWHYSPIQNGHGGHLVKSFQKK